MKKKMSESAKKASPTPLPWLSEDGYAGARLQKYVTAPGKDGFRPWSDADAELIARAVNAHQALVDALQFVHDRIADPERKPRDLYPAFGLDASTALEMVRAALSLAEGKP